MGERGKYDRSKSPATRQKEQRRALVAAATTVFSERGYAAASVEDVVRAAGASRRTFYVFFDDLPDALAAVHDAAGRFAVRMVDDELARETAPAQRLERGIRALLQLVSANPGLARVLFSEARLAGPRLEQRQEKLRAHFAEVLRGVLTDAHARREVAHAPDRLSLIALVAGIEAVGADLAVTAKSGADDLDTATAALVRLAHGACSA